MFWIVRNFSSFRDTRIRMTFGLSAILFLSLILNACSFNLDVSTSSKASKVIPAKSMSITKQPLATYVAGQVFSPELEVTYLDESGNIDVAANRPVVVSFHNNPTGATLQNTLTETPVAGVISFDDLKVNKVGTGYRLKFTTDDGLQEISNPFAIIAAAAAGYDINSAPMTIHANECSSSPVTFNVVDAFGNETSLGSGATVNLVSSNVQFYSDASCSSAITQISLNSGDSAGAFFVSSNLAGSQTFTVSGSAMNSDSQVLTVLPAAAGKLAITTSPYNLVAGTCSGAVVVQSRDLFNNINAVTTDTTVSLAGTGLTFYLDSACSTSAVSTVILANGTSNSTFYFRGTTAGSIPLVASATSFIAATQNQTITSNVATQLAFKTQPTDTVAGVAISPSIEVSLLDQYGNIAGSSIKTISVEIGNNPSATATIVGGNKNKSTTNGVAVFDGTDAIAIQKADVGYTLKASAPGLTTVYSNAFDILGAAISTLEFTTGSQTLTAGDCSSVVNVIGKDQFGNLARASQATVLSVVGTGLSIYSDSSCASSVSNVSIASGNNTVSFYFKGIVAGNPIVKTVSVVSGDAATAVSQNHRINPAAPQSVSFISAVQTTEAGFCSAKVEIKVGDIYGNPVPPVADSTLALSASDGATVFYSDASCTAGNEITSVQLLSGANYGNFYYRSTKSGTDTITVSGSADFGAGSTAVTGSQANTVIHTTPDHLEFETQPALNTLAGASFASSVRVAAKDIYGNICTSYSTGITVDIQNNPPGDGAIVGGAKTVTPSAGVAAFSGSNDIIIYKAANGYSLSATSGTLPAITSNAFNILVGPATKYRYTANPVDTKAGYCSSAAVVIQTEDAYGNISAVSGAKAITYSSNPSGAGGVEFFNDASCTMAAPASIADSSSMLQFYFKPKTSGSNTITVQPSGIDCDTLRGCSTTNSKSFNVDPDEPYALAFSTAPLVSPNQVEAGSCSPAIGLRATDQFGNTTVLSADQIVQLTPSSGSLYADSSCATAIDNGVNPLKITSGSSSAQFYFMSTTTGGGQHTTTAESTFSGTFAGGLSSPHVSTVAQVNAMKAAPPDRFHILQQPGTTIAGQTVVGPFTAELRDRFNNPASTSTAKTYVNIGSYSVASRPTLYGGAGLTAGPNTPTNPPTKTYFPDPPVQSFWSFAVGGQLIYSGSIGLNIQKVGTYSLRLSALGIDYNASTSESASFDVINASPSKLVYLSSSQTLVAGACSGQVSVQSQDIYSNTAALLSNTTVTPSGTGMTFYSDSGCSTPISDVTIASGTHSATFYFKATVSGTQSLLVQASGGDTLTQASQNQTINPDVPQSLALTTPARTTAAGACSAVLTVNSRDQFGNNSPVSSAAVLTISQVGTPGASSLQFYSDAACSSSISSVSLASGSFTSSFYAKGTVAGSILIRLTPDFNASGYVEQTELIVPAALANIAFISNGNQTLTAGDCSSLVTIELRDAYGNPKNGAPTSVKFDTSQAGFQFYSDASCTTAINSSTGISIGTGDTQGSFYFRSTVSGLRDLTVSVSSPAVSNSATQTIDPAGFNRFGFTNGTNSITSLSVTAGACTRIVVQAQDEFGNIVDSNISSQRIVIEGSSSDSLFYSAAGCGAGNELPLTSAGDANHPSQPYITITAAKESDFYLKNIVKGNSTLTARHFDVTYPASLNLTVNPEAPVKLAFDPSLIQSIAGAALRATGPATVKVNILDQFNNITGSTASVTVDMDSTNPNNSGVSLLGTKTASAVAGTSSFATVNITKAGTGYSLRATSTGLTAAVSNLFDVVAAGPTQISISSPAQTVIAGQCSGASTVTLLDPFGNPANASGNLGINLTGTNMTFYSDAGCTSPLSGSELIIADGTSSGNFYFIPTLSGAINISADRTVAPVLTGATQSQTVQPGVGSQLGFGNPVRNNITAGVCAGSGKALEIEVQDQFGNRTTNSTGASLTIQTSGLGAFTRIYSDSSCLTEISKNGSNYEFSIANNAQGVSVYVKDSEAHTLSFSVVASEQPWNSSQNVTIVPGVASKLAYISPAQTGVVAGTCSAAVSIQSQDANGNPSVVSSDKTVTLSSDASVVYYSDSGCSSPISNIQILNGTHSATFYFRTTLAGSHDITVATAGLTSAMQTEVVTFAAVNKLGFYQQPTNTIAGNAIAPAVRVDALDQFGNIVTSFSGNIDIAKAATPATGTLSGTLSITASAGNASFSDLSIEIANTGYTLVATSSGLISATSNVFSILSAAPNSLYFASSAQTLDVKNCSDQVSIGVKDIFGNTATATSSTSIGLVGDGVTFYSDSSCSTIITSSTILSGQTQTHFWFKPTKSGNIAIVGTSAGLTQASQNQTVVPGVPAKLAMVSSPQTVRSGECSGAVTLQSQDADGNETAATSDIAATLLGSNFTFYSDSSCTTTVSSTTIANGTTSKQFWFKGSSLGTSTMMAVASGLAPNATQDQEIIPGYGATLDFITASQNLLTNECSALTSFRILDINGNETSLTSPVVVDLTPTLGVLFYSDSGCTNSINSVTVNPNNPTSGKSIGSFYFKTGSTAGNASTKVEVYSTNSVDADRFKRTGADDTLVHNVTPRAPSQLNMVGNGQTIRVNSCSAAITVQTIDSSNNISPVTTSTVLTLSSSHTVTYYSDSNCTNSIPSAQLTLGVGQSSATFYFKTFVSSTIHINASANVEGTADTDGDDFIINPASASKLVFTTNPADSNPVLKVDSCLGIYNTELRDRFGNIAEADVDYDLVLSSANAKYYRDSSCTDEISSYPPLRDRILKIPQGSSSLPAFYMKTTQIGADNTVISSNAGLENALHTFIVFPAIASKLSFITEPKSLRAGSCSEIIQFKTTDHLGFETGPDGGLTVDLTFSPSPLPAELASGVYAFYSDSGCSAAIDHVTIPDGQSRSSFYVKVKKSGLVNIHMDATDVNADPDIVFPTASQLLNIEPAPAVKFELTRFVSKIPTNLCSSGFAIDFLDTYGNVSPLGGSSSQINLGSNAGDLTFYSDKDCFNQILSPYWMGGTTAFYVKKATPGVVNISMHNPHIPFTANKSVEVTNANIDKVEFTSPVRRIGYNFCSPGSTIEYQDSSGVAKIVSEPGGIDVKLTAPYTYFYTSSNCDPSTVVQKVNIPNGSSTATFYYKAAQYVGQSGFPVTVNLNQINLTADGIAGGSQGYQILHFDSAAPSNKSEMPRTVLLGACTAVDAKYSDPNFAYDLSISVTSSPNLELYSDSNCSTPLVNPMTVVDGGSSSGSVSLGVFYIKATSAANAWYRFSEPHLNSEDISVSVKDLQLKINGNSSIGLTAGSCQVVTAQIQDHTGAPWDVQSADLNIPFTLVPPPINNYIFYVAAYSDATCTTPLNTIKIPVGQNSKSFYLKGSVAPNSGSLVTQSTNSRFANISKSIGVSADAPTKLVLDSTMFDSVILGTCSPVMEFRSIDSYGNISAVPSNTTINLSAQELDIYGFPAGSSFPKSGVFFYSDASCTSPVTSVQISAGQSLSSKAYFKTNFGRQQFAIVAESSVGNTSLIMSSAIDRLAFSGLPTSPSENAYTCRAFTIQHQEIGAGTAIDPEKTIRVTVTTFDGYSSTGVPLTSPYVNFYRNSDCSDAGASAIYETIVPLPGTPTQAAIEANVTKTYYMISKTLAPVRMRVTSPGRASSDILVSSTVPSDAKVAFREGLESIEAGICSGDPRYVTFSIDPRVEPVYRGRLELGLRTSDASGARIIYGGNNTRLDVLSANLKFYSDSSCATEVSSVSIAANKEISAPYYFKSTKAGPNEASALGQVGGDAFGVSGRAFYNIGAGPVYQIGFGSDPQTIRAGDCSEDLVLQVQDRYGNEKSDKIENEVSFVYPAGFTLYSDNSCSTNIATTFIPANQSRKKVWFRHSTAGSATISPLPVRQLESVPQTQRILSGAAAFLRFATAPKTVPKGECSSALTMQVQDLGGNAVNVGTDTVVDLTGESGSGMVFFLDSDCKKSSEVTSITIPSGANSKDFYFMSFKEGTTLITGKNLDFVDAKQNQNIVAGLPTKLAFNTLPFNTFAGVCSNGVKVIVADAYGSQSASATNTTLSLIGDNTTFYSDRFCTSSISTLNLNIGDQNKTFYFKRTQAGEFDLKVADNALGTLAPAIQTQTIKPMIMSALKFLTEPASVAVGRCSPMTKVGVIDQYGNETKVTERSSVLMSFAGSNIQFYSDQQCSVVIPGNQINLTENKEYAEFYFGSNQVGSRAIDVTNNKNLDNTSQTQTFTSGASTKLGFLTPARSVPAGGCSAVITVVTRDDYNYETNAGQNYLVNLTPPSGASFFSDSSCSAGNEISTTSILSGTSQTNVYLKVGSSLGNFTIGVDASGLTSQTQNLSVVGAAPSRLVFTSAAKTGVVIETCSSKVDFGFQDAFGNATKTISSTNVSLSSTGASFYSDIGCTVPVSNITVAGNQTSGSFYFKPTQVGSVPVEVNATGLAGDIQYENATAGTPVKLVFSSSPQTFVAGNCRTATVQTQDALDNPASSATGRTIVLASSGSTATFYSSLDCSGGSSNNVNLTSGSSSAQFSFMITQSGTSNFTASSSGLAQALQSQTILPATPAKLAFTSPSRTVVAGVCSSNVTIQSQDAFSNPSAVGSNTSVSLTGSDLQFYSDSSCSSAIASVQIANGTHSATLYFKSTVSGVKNLSIAGGSLTAANQNQTINSASIEKLAFINSPLSLNAGNCGLLNMQFQDSFGNASDVGASTLVTYQLSGITSSVYSDSGCTNAISNQNVSSGNSFNAYFKSNLSGSATLRISAPGITFADQTEVVAAGAPNKLAFTTASLTVNSGQCSGAVGPVTVQVQDLLGNSSGVASASSFLLSGAGYTFYSDASCTNTISTINISAGAHTASFYFKKLSAGSANLTVGMTGFSSVNQSQTVNPLAISKLGMSTPTQTIPSAQCSSVIVQTQDANGNAVARGANTNVNLAVISGTLSIYSDAACSTNVSSLVIPSGSASASPVYVKSNTSGTAILRASDADSVLGNGSQTITISSGAATAIAFVSSGFSTTVGTCSAQVTIQTRDSFGNPSILAASKTINLSALPTVTPSSDGLLFYSDVGCTSQITSINISAGASSGSFYYKSLKANAYTVSAVTSGFTTIQQIHNLNSAAMNSLAVVAGGVQSALPAGACSSAVYLEGRDVYSNLAKPSSNSTFNLSGTNLNFFSDSGCSSSISSFNILTSGSSATFYYRSTVVGSYTINITGPFSATASTTIVPGTPNTLEVGSAISAIRTGMCSTAMTVRSKDSYGHYSNLASAQTVLLQTAPSAGQLYSDFGCLNALSGGQVTINAGSSTSQVFYFKQGSAQTTSLNASLAGFADANISINVSSAGPAINIYDHPAGNLYTSGASFDYGLATIDTERSFYVKNDGNVVSGQLSIQLLADLLNPAGVGSATMWALKTDMCSGQTLTPGSSCLVTIEFKALTGSKPSGDFYYSNLKVQSNATAAGSATVDLRLFGIKQ